MHRTECRNFCFTSMSSILLLLCILLFIFYVLSFYIPFDKNSKLKILFILFMEHLLLYSSRGNNSIRNVKWVMNADAAHTHKKTRVFVIFQVVFGTPKKCRSLWWNGFIHRCHCLCVCALMFVYIQSIWVDCKCERLSFGDFLNVLYLVFS